MFETDTLDEFDLQIPDDLLRTEIERQISFIEPVHTFTKNFLEIFYKRQLLKTNNRETEEDENDPESIEKNIYNTDLCYQDVILNLKHRCGLLIDTGTGEYDPKVINNIYSMFIFRLHHNIIDFIVASININKQMFAQQFTSNLNNSNISMKSARKTFKNKTDAVIAVNYRNIVDMILQDEAIINPENILNVLYKNNPDDYEYRMITQLYNTVYLGFDIPVFCQFVRNAYSNIMSLENLKSYVIERLLPSFPIKNPDSEEVSE
jgi:hypothetical protein